MNQNQNPTPQGAMPLDDDMLAATSGGSGPLKNDKGEYLFKCNDCGRILTQNEINHVEYMGCTCGSRNVAPYYGPSTSSFHALGR